MTETQQEYHVRQGRPGEGRNFVVRSLTTWENMDWVQQHAAAAGLPVSTFVHRLLDKWIRMGFDVDSTNGSQN
jgi:hypothetical protein